MKIKKNSTAYYTLLFFISIMQITCKEKHSANELYLNANTYYLSKSGDDNNNGSKQSPWRTIQKLNSIQLKPGDSILLEGGQTFYGTIIVDSNESGTNNKPVVISSYGNNNAIINAGNASALIADHAENLNINHLSFIGAGRKDGNAKNGVAIMHSRNILLNDLDISGFQKAGLLVFSSLNVKVDKVYAHENGFAGISVSGLNGKTDCEDISVSNCIAENNPGDPTNFTNHSGNGIIAGFCKNVIIEYCVATNNGWDMPRKGNGPVGIWCYEADSVIIQHCISYRNKTAAGAADGGGYDLDGGTTNSIIQYCLSYQNEGSGFGIFQYKGASNWYNNIIRFNISENDGNISTAHGGIFIWNSSHDDNQFKDLLFYNNTIYNDNGAAISYSWESDNTGFKFYNNIFVAKDTIVIGKEISVTYLANNWWSLADGFNINGIKNINSWAVQKNKEQLNNKIVGLSIDPRFVDAGKSSLTDPLQLKTFFSYRLPLNSQLRNRGLNLENLYSINIGLKDFNQWQAPKNGIGASF